MTTDNVQALPALSVEALTNAIAQYKDQYQQVVNHLTHLQNEQANANTMLHTIAGAIAALEQVIQNYRDEAARQTSKPDDARQTSKPDDAG